MNPPAKVVGGIQIFKSQPAADICCDAFVIVEWA
jgi:hypothetical protein